MGKNKYERSGPDCNGERKRAGYEANESTLNSPAFKKNCKLASVEPTRRQASKYRQNRGLASQFR